MLAMTDELAVEIGSPAAAIKAMIEENDRSFSSLIAEIGLHLVGAASGIVANLAPLLRKQFEPGTVSGDYFLVVVKRTLPLEREAVLARLALNLRVGRGLRPRAMQALRLIAQFDGLAESVILRLETPAALLEALTAFREDGQTRRDGTDWRKDEHGKILRFTPKEVYTGSDLSRGPAQAHLRDLARGCLEAALIERADLPDADDDSHIEWTEILAPSPSTEAALFAFAARKQAAAALETGYRRLSRREREVYELFEEENREIATQLALREPTVRRLKANIRKKIAAAMKKT